MFPIDWLRLGGDGLWMRGATGRTANCWPGPVGGPAAPGGTMMLTELGVAAPVVAAAAVAVVAVVVDGVAVVVAVVGRVVALAAAKLSAPQFVPLRMEECSVVRLSDCTPTPVLAEGGRSPGCGGHVRCSEVWLEGGGAAGDGG